MIRIVITLLVALGIAGCGGETSSGDQTASSSGGSPQCGLQGPPTGSCSAGDECSFFDGGCSFDSYCKDGSWATVRSCSADDGCPREGLTAGGSCADDGAQCRYDEGGACVSDLQCTGGVWVDSGC